jgi:hypothetical protein
VNALKKVDMERMRKAEITTLSISRETRTNKRTQKRRKVDQDSPDDPK